MQEIRDVLASENIRLKQIKISKTIVLEIKSNKATITELAYSLFPYRWQYFSNDHPYQKYHQDRLVGQVSWNPAEQ